MKLNTHELLKLFEWYNLMEYSDRYHWGEAMGTHNRYTLEYQMCPRIGILVQYKMMYRHPLQVYESRQPESQHHSKQNYVVYNNWQTLTENNHPLGPAQYWIKFPTSMSFCLFVDPMTAPAEYTMEVVGSDIRRMVNLGLSIICWTVKVLGPCIFTSRSFKKIDLTLICLQRHKVVN